MYSSMCGRVNLTFQLSFVDILLFVRVVDVLSSIPSTSGTDVLRTYHFRENFLVYTWACIHFLCLLKLYPRVRRVSSSWAFQPCGELIGTKITWRLRNLHITYTLFLGKAYTYIYAFFIKYKLHKFVHKHHK